VQFGEFRKLGLEDPRSVFLSLITCLKEGEVRVSIKYGKY
jgi:hypothetical protein